MVRDDNRLKNTLFMAALVLCILGLSGCSYLGFYTRKAHWQKTMDRLPTMSVLNRVAPEDSLVLVGPLVKPPDRRGALLLIATSSQYRQDEKVAVVQLKEPADYYMAFLPKGEYTLYLFADLNGDGTFERNELIGRSDASVSLEGSKDGTIVEGPALTLDFEKPGRADFRVNVRVRPSSYLYASLDDEFFDPRFGDEGLYNPTALIAHTQGFFFGLEEYDSSKATVLFVHGISGTPRDWKFMVEGLDRSRFQPFFFYYPSGLPLDKLGALLANVLENLAGEQKKGKRKIILVAHSMGGLVALSAINKLGEQGASSSLAFYASFSTPYGGNDSARTGVEKAPLVVPAWRDIATGSDFITSLGQVPFPKKLPFHLFFTYHDQARLKLGESGDGVVTLKSQLLPSMQNAATRIYGFNETHDGVLTSETVRNEFNNLLEEFSVRRQGER
jgi:pimeloyl-ACP methyl ester carboxylesterase